jgi:hypothetical protein
MHADFEISILIAVDLLLFYSSFYTLSKTNLKTLHAFRLVNNVI